MISKSNKKRSAFSQLAIKYLVCMLITTAVSGLVMCIIAKLMCVVDIPQAMCVPLGTISLCIGSFSGGIALAMLVGEKGLLCGFLMGITVFAVLWVALMIGGSFIFTDLVVVKAAAFCAAGAIGGFVGIMICEKAHKHH